MKFSEHKSERGKNNECMYVRPPKLIELLMSNVVLLNNASYIDHSSEYLSLSHLSISSYCILFIQLRMWSQLVLALLGVFLILAQVSSFNCGHCIS